MNCLGANQCRSALDDLCRHHIQAVVCDQVTDLMGGNAEEDGSAVLRGCLIHKVFAVGGGAQIGVDVGVHGKTEGDLIVLLAVITVFVHPDGLEVIVVYGYPDRTVTVAKHICDMVNDILEIGRGKVIIVGFGGSQRGLL